MDNIKIQERMRQLDLKRRNELLQCQKTKLFIITCIISLNGELKKYVKEK